MPIFLLEILENHWDPRMQWISAREMQLSKQSPFFLQEFWRSRHWCCQVSRDDFRDFCPAKRPDSRPNLRLGLERLDSKILRTRWSSDKGSLRCGKAIGGVEALEHPHLTHSSKISSAKSMELACYVLALCVRFLRLSFTTSECLSASWRFDKEHPWKGVVPALYDGKSHTMSCDSFVPQIGREQRRKGSKRSSTLRCLPFCASPCSELELFHMPSFLAVYLQFYDCVLLSPCHSMMTSSFHSLGATVVQLSNLQTLSH